MERGGARALMLALGGSPCEAVVESLLSGGAEVAGGVGRRAAEEGGAGGEGATRISTRSTAAARRPRPWRAAARAR